MRGLALALACCCALAAQQLESLLKQAVAAQQSGDTATAIRLYQEALQQRPDLGQIRSNLGAALVHDGRFAEAIEQYKVALQSAPGNPAISLNLALAHFKLGNYREAADLLAGIQPQQPENLQIVELLASCWNQLGQSAKVVDLLTPIAHAHPDDRAIAFLLGTALLNEGRTTLAELVLNRILQNGESAEAQLLLGASKLNSHDYLAAMGFLQKAAELNPNLPLVMPTTAAR